MIKPRAAFLSSSKCSGNRRRTWRCAVPERSFAKTIGGPSTARALHRDKSPSSRRPVTLPVLAAPDCRYTSLVPCPKRECAAGISVGPHSGDNAQHAGDFAGRKPLPPLSRRMPVRFRSSGSLVRRCADTIRRQSAWPAPVTKSSHLASGAIAGAHCRVTFFTKRTVPAPVTWGIFRHVILVPPGFEQLPTESRNAVLSHELAHVSGDTTSCSAYWRKLAGSDLVPASYVDSPAQTARRTGIGRVMTVCWLRAESLRYTRNC